jgi:asparagine synthase (glutamine-hydrolysing)
VYKRFHYETPKVIDGDYSFVIWDREEDELFCCRSKTGRRTLYYCENDECFIFSSLLRSFFQYFEKELTLNDRYVFDFLSIRGIRNELDPQQSIYKDIKQIPPGCCLTFGKKRAKSWQYWKPKKSKEIILKDDKEYELALYDLLEKAIRKRVNGSKKTGILLSGGFDSGAVAAISSRILSKEKKRLYTFTSIPFSGYQNWLSKNRIADESLNVKKYKMLYDNLELSFLPCEDKDSFVEINNYIRVLEQPYKFVGNSLWFFESLNIAQQRGIDILLTGQMGNSTISWGGFNQYLVFLKEQFHFRELLHEMKSYAILRRISFSQVLKMFLKDQLPKRFKKLLLMLKKKFVPLASFPVNQNTLAVLEQKKRFNQFGWENDFLSVSDSISHRLKLLNPAYFSHIGAMYYKAGLRYNIFVADPTEDVDVIEFCLNLPENQFVRNGVERYLIKRTMSGYIPENIISSTERGKQSADWSQRIKQHWSMIKEELLSVGDFKLEKKYLDRNRIHMMLAELSDFDFIRGDNKYLRILFRTLVFSRFLRMVEKGVIFEDNR